MASDEKPDTETPDTDMTPETATDESDASREDAPADPKKPDETPEVGGREGPDPTRYGDWEINGRCVDF